MAADIPKKGQRFLFCPDFRAKATKLFDRLTRFFWGAAKPSRCEVIIGRLQHR